MIVQPTLEVPADIAAGLASGALVRNGGVVRDLTGKIVKLLDEAAAPPAAAADSGALVGLQAGVRPLNVTASTKLLVITRTALSVAGVAWLWHQKRKPMPAAAESITQSDSGYSQAWRTYVHAAGEGKLDVGIVNRLIAAIDAVLERGEVVSLGPSAGQSSDLVLLVANHTKRLVEAAGETFEEPPPAGTESPLAAIRRHLVIQEQVLDRSAES